MRAQHRFRPAAIQPLEDRVVLSAASSVVAAIGTTEVLKLHGSMVVSRAVAPIGGGQQARLTGEILISRLGEVQIDGNLSSNGSLPPPASDTVGTVTLTDVSSKEKGNLVISLTGPSANLASSTTKILPMAASITSSSGIFKSLVLGIDGRAELEYKTPAKTSLGAAGTFELRVTVRLA